MNPEIYQLRALSDKGQRAMRNAERFVSYVRGIHRVRNFRRRLYWLRRETALVDKANRIRIRLWKD